MDDYFLRLHDLDKKHSTRLQSTPYIKIHLNRKWTEIRLDRSDGFNGAEVDIEKWPHEKKYQKKYVSTTRNFLTWPLHM